MLLSPLTSSFSENPIEFLRKRIFFNKKHIEVDFNLKHRKQYIVLVSSFTTTYINCCMNKEEQKLDRDGFLKSSRTE